MTDQQKSVQYDWLAAALGVPEAFPWQRALLDQLMDGRCPRSLDIPTGLGKTAVMAIWLVARASGAGLPRRLVYVVDRRAVVDQATEVAERLRDWVDQTPEVSSALGFSEHQPMPISTLRGHFADNREWLGDPSSTAIVVGTIDMIGSRLLFEGYGVSRKMRPYHAGLLGTDTLLVLDEAHLVPPFEALIESIAEGRAEFGPRETGERPLAPPLALLSLSATGKATKGTFSLGVEDERHPTVQRRLGAEKRLILRAPLGTENDSSLPQALAQEAWIVSASGTAPLRTIVFCNGRNDAKSVEAELRALEKKSGVEVDVELFVGGRRVHERERAAGWLREHGFIAGHHAKPRKSTFLIATSAGEVGVDLDADHMVSDVVAWERMIQRLGRVNRRGDGAAQIVVVPTLPNKKESQALEKATEAQKPEERTLVARRLMLNDSLRAIAMLPRVGDGIDASPGALRQLKQRSHRDPELAALLSRASTPPPLAPALSRALVEAWSMTSLEEHAGRPEVEPWIRGWVEREPQTTIVWRARLPVDRKGQALSDDEVEAYFDAAPPHLLEELETETYHALEWLLTRLAALGDPREFQPDSNQESAASAANSPTDEQATARSPILRALRCSDVVAFILERSGRQLPISGAVLDELRGPGGAERQLALRLSGATLVVDTRLGGLSNGLLDGTVAEACDIGEVRSDLPFRVLESVPADSTEDANGWVEELRLVTESSADGVPLRWLVIERPRGAGANTEEGRSTSRAQLLDEHQSWVEREARAIGTRLGLADELLEVLALAARLHDEGKRAPRWQRAFNAPKDGAYGKTLSRPNLALLDRYRHEFGSLPYAERHPEVRKLGGPIRDLCLHLIAAHHGFARPVIRTDGCEDAPPSALITRAQEVAFRFSRLEARWGPWGLAWWEALVRAADQQASRKNDEPRGGAHV